MMVVSAFASFTVEGPPSAARGDANALVKAGKEAGLKGRVVRVYQDAVGWRFVVRLEGFEDEGSAKEAAKTLARGASGPVTVLDDKRTILFETAAQEVSAPQAAPDPSMEKAPDKSPETEPEQETEWLGAARKAHRDPLAEIASSDRVKMVYTRELADGRIAKHTYARRGTDLYLDVQAKKGDVEASTTLALADAAWLVRDGASSSQDLQRSRLTVEKFGPAGTIPVVLSLKQSAAEVPSLATLSGRGTAKVGGDLCKVAGSGAGKEEVLIAFGEDGLIRRISMSGGAQVVEYSDYTEVGEAKMPKRVVTWVDGGIRDTVSVVEFQLDGDLPDAWFSAPAK